MAHFIIDTYKIKWEILNFARNISAQGNKFRHQLRFRLSA